MFCSSYFNNGLPRHFALMFSMVDFVLNLALNFRCCQNQGFCSHKIALIKNRVYMHNAKDNCFPNSSVLENPFHRQSE